MSTIIKNIYEKFHIIVIDNSNDVDLEKYDETVFVEEALHRLVEIHYYLGLENEAKKYASIHLVEKILLDASINR